MTISAAELAYKSLGAIRRQIKRNPDLLKIRDPESHGATVLHHIAWSGDLRTAKLLIELGADVDIKDDVGETPLHGAAGWGNTEIVKFLIASGADVNSICTDGMTPLDWATDYKEGDVLEVLKAAGAISHRE